MKTKNKRCISSCLRIYLWRGGNRNLGGRRILRFPVQHLHQTGGRQNGHVHVGRIGQRLGQHPGTEYQRLRNSAHDRNGSNTLQNRSQVHVFTHLITFLYSSPSLATNKPP